MHRVLVVDQAKDFKMDVPNLSIVCAKDYLAKDPCSGGHTIVFNLCKQYRYQSRGYYVSLLAEARGQRVVPSVSTIMDFRSKALVRGISEELQKTIDSSLCSLKSSEFELSIYFGQNMARSHQKLARALFNLFSAPIPENHRDFFMEAARNYFSKKQYRGTRESNLVYDLGILINPGSSTNPSNTKALDLFQEAAAFHGMDSELITKDDQARLGEFDALFLRETTSVRDHTYRMARYAFRNGLVVMDDPLSILRCTNKVFLTELLHKNKIPQPRTHILTQENRQSPPENSVFPLVLKKPDSYFSLGVMKVHSIQEYVKAMGEILEESELVLGQEYLPTDYDWRIGVLDGQPLFACKYFMAKGHWQIYNWSGDPQEQEGLFDTIPLERVPQEVLSVAVKASNLVGNGLYGVDIKETGSKAVVIEVNDNPNIDGGIEDQILGPELYRKIMGSFRYRLDEQRRILR